MNDFSLLDFIRESNRIERIEREATQFEFEATNRFMGLPKIGVSDLVDLVQVYQPDALPRFVRGRDVMVGAHVPIPGGPAVHRDLVSILDRCAVDRGEVAAYRRHVEYETLHPFTDGNGRSGRALWLWMMGGISQAPLGFLHHFYYQALQASRRSWLG